MTDYVAEKTRDWAERPVPVQSSQAVGRLPEALVSAWRYITSRTPGPWLHVLRRNARLSRLPQ